MSIKRRLSFGQITGTQTIVRSSRKEFKLNHYFMPSLATEIALREGIVLLDTPTIRKIEQTLKQTEENGLWRWDDTKPIDFDDTLVAKNVFTLLGRENKTRIPLSMSNEGGTYTYLGGIKTKANNTVDLIINARILDSIINLGIKTSNDKEICDYINNNKNKLYEPIENISKYYLSEGFLIYVASKIRGQIDINIDELIEYKLNKLKTATDIELALLASPKNKQVQKKYKTIKINSSGLYLFQQSSTGKKFRNLFLEEVINLSANNKSEEYFDKLTAKIYSSNGEQLYSYEKHAKTLNEILSICKIKTNDQLTELAIGTGNFLRYISKKYTNIFGIDSSLEMLNCAKNKIQNKSTVKLIDASKFIKQSKAIYSINFIDLYSSGIVEFWSENILKTDKILENIYKNLERKGVFLLHKKEEKKTNGFELKQWSKKEKHTIKHTYLFQDEHITFRKTYTKSFLKYNEFESKLNKFGLIRIQENKNWIAYVKI